MASTDRDFRLGGPRPNDLERDLHWAQHCDLIDAIEEQRVGGPITLYASVSIGGRLFLHSALVPAAVVDDPPPTRFVDGYGGANDAWRFSRPSYALSVERLPPEAVVGGTPATSPTSRPAARLAAKVPTKSTSKPARKARRSRSG